MIDTVYNKYYKENQRYFIYLLTGKSFWRKQRYEIWKKICSYLIFLLVYFQSRLNHRKVGNRIENDLIVTFTSFPARINTVWFCIESIIRQSIRPSKILLYLSKDEFDNSNIHKLNFLKRYQKYGFDIIWVEGNLKSHKKYYYAMQTFKDKIIITIDDDLYYPSNMIQRLLELHKDAPLAICANITRKISPIFLYDYSRWDKFPDNYIYNSTSLLVAIGCGGVLYPKEFRPDTLFDINLIKEHAFHADDLWLKAMELVHHFPVITGAYFAPPIVAPSTQKVGLLKKNCGKENGNNIQWKSLVKQFNLSNYIQ